MIANCCPASSYRGNNSNPRGSARSFPTTLWLFFHRSLFHEKIGDRLYISTSFCVNSSCRCSLALRSPTALSKSPPFPPHALAGEEKERELSSGPTEVDTEARVMERVGLFTGKLVPEDLEKLSSAGQSAAKAGAKAGAEAAAAEGACVHTHYVIHILNAHTRAHAHC